MTDKENESFKKWFKETFPDTYGLNSYESKSTIIETQQKKIDHYKKLAMDNQARYSGALETIETLEKQVAELQTKIKDLDWQYEELIKRRKEVRILKEAVEFYSDIDKQPVIDKDYVISEKHTGKKAREALKQIEEMKKCSTSIK